MNPTLRTADAVPRFEKAPRFRLKIVRATKQLVFMDLNQNRAPMDDPAFRRAVSHSPDRASIVHGAFGGYTTPTSSPLAPRTAGHDKALAARNELGYDPAKARVLFEKAGWRLADGVLTRNGQPAKLVLRGVSGSDAVDRALAVMYRGRIVEEGPRARIFTNPRPPYTVGLIQSVPVPDPSRRALRSLPGEVNNLLSTGCGFAGRCAHVQSQCHVAAPILVPLGEGHRVACWQIAAAEARLPGGPA